MAFEGMYRHVGQLVNTGKNVVVVFMQLPDDPDYALVIDTDALPDSYNESLRRVLESEEGQQAKNFADILGRRMSPDGSNLSMLQKFHNAGRLQKVSIDNVAMTPRRGVNWPLRQVLQAVTETKDQLPQDFNDLSPEDRAILAAETKKFNMHASNIGSDDIEGNKSMAAGLLEQSRMLEADAIAKREQAYRLDPNLVPRKAPPLPSLVVEQPKRTAKKLPAAAKAKASTTAKTPSARAKKTA